DVSVTTVSHALNDKGRLNPDTRQRVRDVAKRLGYKPNPAARSLVSGKTGLIAVIPSLPKKTRVSFSDLGYFTELIGAATDVDVEDGGSRRGVFDHFADRGARRVGFVPMPPMAAFLQSSAVAYASWWAANGQESLAEVIDPAEMDRDEAGAMTRSVERLFDRA